MHNTKVVDLEKLSKSGIQHFFIWSQEEGENLKLHNWILELQFIYETAPAVFSYLRSPCSLPTASRRTPAPPPGCPRVATRPKPPSSAHGLPLAIPSGCTSERHAPPPTPCVTHRRRRCAARHLAVAFPGQAFPRPLRPTSPSPSSLSYLRHCSPPRACLEHPGHHCHGCRARLAAEPPSPAFFHTNQPPERKLLGLLKLSVSSAPSFPH